MSSAEHNQKESGMESMCEYRPWWALFIMMTSSNGNIFRVTGPMWGEFSGHRWLPLTKPVTRNFNVFFNLRLNKLLSKRRHAVDFRRHRAHCNVTVMIMSSNKKNYVYNLARVLTVRHPSPYTISMWLIDAIWWRRSQSNLVRVLTCGLFGESYTMCSTYFMVILNRVLKYPVRSSYM